MDVSEDSATDQSGVDWHDGVPVSRRFDDPYYSLNDGWAETTHVFLGGNDLPARFRPGFHIAELGFGTGLNVLVSLAAWRATGLAGPLRFTSFEAFPLDPATIRAALDNIPQTAPLRASFVAYLQGDRAALLDLDLTLIEGDARQTLPIWPGKADAWFLDGFSPAKNPELWGADLMGHVAAATAPGGTAATYTAAGFVRRGLDAAGFEVTRSPGYGRKRHMTRAVVR
ncbi:MAG: tRNA (5-methylaminomethyl-2-thiouridine)(34)-methyltransferase MnmD [Pseudomonadota bacterium]